MACLLGIQVYPIFDLKDRYRTMKKQRVTMVSCNEYINHSEYEARLMDYWNWQKDYAYLCKVLCVTSTSVDKSYYQLCCRYHPDKSTQPNSEENMKVIGDAYTRLKSSSRL